MAEEAKDPNAAKGETSIAAENARSTSDAETTALPDNQPDNSDQKPEMSEAAKQPELANPAAGEAHTPTVAEENAPSTSEAVATPLPSANKPDMEATGPDKAPEGPNVSEGIIDTTPAKARAAEKSARPAGKAAKEGGAAEAPARAKKEKAPALEDKPFAEFINQDFLPSLQQTLSKQGAKDLNLQFEKRVLPIKGLDNSDCWQVIGHLNGGKQFLIGFLKEDINSPKVFCWADEGSTPSLLESFMIDERRVNLDLLLLYAVQRLNAQKWLTLN